MKYRYDLFKAHFELHAQSSRATEGPQISFMVTKSDARKGVSVDQLFRYALEQSLDEANKVRQMTPSSLRYRQHMPVTLLRKETTSICALSKIRRGNVINGESKFLFFVWYYPFLASSPSFDFKANYDGLDYHSSSAGENEKICLFKILKISLSSFRENGRSHLNLAKVATDI